MKKMKCAVSMILSLVMLASAAILPNAFAEGGKYTTEATPDGWTKVINDNGIVLGYTEGSGVTILEDDGYAFKDMNKNGELDTYEDWRLDSQTRAEDLVSQMTIDEQIPILFLDRYDTSYKADKTNGISDYVYSILDAGVRGICTPFAYKSVDKTVEYVNAMQSYVEALPFGIPVQQHGELGVSLTTSWPKSLAFAATFDPALADAYAKIVSKEYRAIGVSMTMTPQIDISAEPRWSRIVDTYGEDPMLVRDFAVAFTNALQSTYDADGNDTGWGTESVTATVKHYPGDGSGESGRESHNFYGKYAVYPGDNLDTMLIPFKACFDLPGLTEAAGAVMPSYSIGIDEDGEALGDEKVASAYSSYKLTDLLRDELGFKGLITSDFIIVEKNPQAPMMSVRNWGVEDMTAAERRILALKAGLNQFAGEAMVESLREAYELGVAELGQEEFDAIITDSAIRVLVTMFNTRLFENAYVSTEYANSVVNSVETQAAAYDVAVKSVVMVKNAEGMIHSAEAAEKATIYVPMTFNGKEWAVPFDMNVLKEYFNVVTDTIGNPTGEDKKYTENDIIRATDAELQNVDFALVRISSPANVGGGYDAANEKYIPLSLQYTPYTANSTSVRTQSLGGDTVEVVIESPYGAQSVEENENRSYFGNSAVISNATDLDAVLYAAEHVDKVIVSATLSNPTIFSEFEGQVDAILLDFGLTGATATKAVSEIVTGAKEPSGLLPMQMPANMETVEAQLEDVPRDMECYVDAEGNTYDFAFGLNWSGVIDDERVATYNVPAIEE